ncbi:MAG: response regulator [Thermodesulfobacteriota bacterium]
MTKRILVIDDEASIRTVLDIHLKRAGFMVTLAATGAEGIEFALTRDFDLMLCDLKLTDMNGIDIIKKVKAENISLPVIVVSGFIDSDVVREAKEIGSVDYLRKPFLKNELLSIVNSVLDSSNA